MKNIKIGTIVIALAILSLHTGLNSRSGITFRHNGGRLGDVLLDYAKNYYIAYKYDLDLYIPTLPYVVDFKLCTESPQLSGHLQDFNQTITIYDDRQVDQSRDNTLYMSTCYIPVDGIADLDLFHSHMFQCSIEQPLFGDKIKELLTPIESFEFAFPDNLISVAMHIRKGGGFDHPLASELYRPNELQEGNGTRISKYEYVDRDQPFKFPPEQYYVDQLIFLYVFLEQQPFYVFLFTDDREPQHIVERIQEKLAQQGITNITFDYRKSENAHNRNIIEDISFMSKFDYLIKSGSHYPWIAQMIGNHKAIISPVEYRWNGNYLNIIHSEIVFPDRENHVLKKFKIPSTSNIENEHHSDS